MYAMIMIFLPIIGGVFAYFVGQKSEKMRNILSISIAGITFLMALGMYVGLKDADSIVYVYPKLLPPFGLSFRLDWLSVVLATIGSFVWFLISIYSLEYMKSYTNLNRYYAFVLVTLGATIGTFLSGDLVTLFLFFELMSLSSFVLVIHEGTEKAMKAGNLYLIMTIAGGLALFFGIIAVYELAGTVAFSDVGILANGSTLSLLAYLAFLAGFGMKAGMFPLHVWLPEAHPVAPSPASALLSGVMLKVGAFGLLRVIFNVYNVDFIASIGWNNILLVISAITIIIGSVYAILQTDIKRRLAYSSVGQMGYILLGMALLSKQALIGDIFHVFAHAIMKSCLFLAAGALILQTGKRDIRELNGVGKKMPITMICFTMASLAMIGIPPFTGFLSKWLLGLGALEVGYPIYAILLLVSSLLNSVYYLPIIINAFFKKSTEDFSNVKEISRMMLIPIIVLAIGTVIFDLLPVNIPLELSAIVAEVLFGRGAGM